ncbi:hypothetical protein EAO76_41190 [Streptomyces sp. sk2.1]|nr:hypothetical protein EAO76_41190 [Streptomyces sp. sk2.1]
MAHRSCSRKRGRSSAPAGRASVPAGPRGAGCIGAGRRRAARTGTTRKSADAKCPGCERRPNSLEPGGTRSGRPNPRETRHCPSRQTPHRAVGPTAWLAGCRRLHHRYEHEPEHFLAFTSIACTFVCHRRPRTNPCVVEAAP